MEVIDVQIVLSEYGWASLYKLLKIQQFKFPQLHTRIMYITASLPKGTGVVNAQDWMVMSCVSTISTATCDFSNVARCVVPTYYGD
jgi:hypothetical protein